MSFLPWTFRLFKLETTYLYLCMKVGMEVGMEEALEEMVTESVEGEDVVVVDMEEVVGMEGEVGMVEEEGIVVLFMCTGNQRPNQQIQVNR